MNLELIKSEAHELLSITFVSPEVQAYACLAQLASPPPVRFKQFLTQYHPHVSAHFGHSPTSLFLGLTGVEPVQTVFDRAIVTLAEVLIFTPNEPETLSRAIREFYEFILARCARLQRDKRHDPAFDPFPLSQ